MTDETTAERQAAALAERIASNAPSPGTGEALRRYFTSIVDGQPNYDDMTPKLAAIARQHWPTASQWVKTLGKLRSIKFLRVGPAGNNVYEVEFENAKLEARIGPLTADGKVAVRDWRRPPDPGMDLYYVKPQTLVKISQRRRLNLLIAGEGSPTVILAPGGGGTTLEWRRVQHAIPLLTARTVSFDNAGMGFSDPGPLPRTGSAIVEDLRAALKAADIPPPYVLAGFSLGGLYMRLFAFLYPQEVVGMVMVDSTPEHLDRRMCAATGRSAPTWRELLERRRGPLLRLEQLARAGALVPGTPEYDQYVGGPLSTLTPAVNAARVAQRTSPGFLRALRSESSAVESATSDEVAAARRPLGDMPLIVLTAGKRTPMPDEPVEAGREALRTMHDEIAALSTRGERRTIDAGHAIPLEKPEAVVAAIEEVLAMVRGG